MAEWVFLDGHKVAFDELALFFNNNTIEYGVATYEDGMTKAEWIEALEKAGFELALAKAFATKYGQVLADHAG